MKNNIALILLFIIVGLAGYGLFLQHELDVEQRKHFATRLGIFSSEVKQLRLDLEEKKDSIITIHKHIRVLERKSEEQNEIIQNTNDINRVHGLYIQLRTGDNDYRQ